MLLNKLVYKNAKWQQWCRPPSQEHRSEKQPRKATDRTCHLRELADRARIKTPCPDQVKKESILHQVSSLPASPRTSIAPSEAASARPARPGGDEQPHRGTHVPRMQIHKGSHHTINQVSYIFPPDEILFQETAIISYLPSLINY